MTTADYIKATAADRGITLTQDQMTFAILDMDSAVFNHYMRVNSWIAAGIEYEESAAVCDYAAKAKAAIRQAINS